MDGKEARKDDGTDSVRVLLDSFRAGLRKIDCAGELNDAVTLDKEQLLELGNLMNASEIFSADDDKNSNTNFEQALINFLAEQAPWPEKLFTWKDLEGLVVHLKRQQMNRALSLTGLRDGDYVITSSSSAQLMKNISWRISRGDFPAVKCEELKSKNQQEAARNILILLDGETTTKIDDYLSVYRPRANESLPNQHREAMWFYIHLYDYLLKYLWKRSLEKRVMRHKHHQNIFLPLIPTQCITSEEERKSAEAIVAQVCPEVLPAINISLWTEWQEHEGILDITGEQPDKAFASFIRKYYFRILEQVCRQTKADNIGFIPLLPVDRFATEGVCGHRKAWLRLATKDDGDEAEKAMQSDYERVVKKQRVNMQSVLRRFPVTQNQFAVKSYYTHLINSVKKRIRVQSDFPNVLSVAQTLHAQTDTIQDKPHEQGLQVDAYRRTSVEENLGNLDAYVSSRDIMCKMEENSLINFQGSLYWCEAEAREVKTVQTYTATRRHSGFVARRVASLILVDQTGPVWVTVWNDLAEQMTELWQRLQDSQAFRPSLSNTRIINFQRIRVCVQPKTSWSGECLTRIRCLQSVPNPNVPAKATILTITIQPTTYNMLRAVWTLPPAECCIIDFPTIQSRLHTPFRVTLKGIITDVKPVDFTHSGNKKETELFLYCQY